MLALFCQAQHGAVLIFTAAQLFQQTVLFHFRHRSGHRSLILVANLKPAVLCGVESQGMILAADCSEDDVKVIFVDGIPEGSKVR